MGGFDLRDFLGRNLVPYEWLNISSDSDAKQMVEVVQVDQDRLPIVVLEDGDILSAPPVHLVAERLGFQISPGRNAYDLVVVGAGPAGFAAAVTGASEGLSTVVLEYYAPGGQVRTTSRIEDYLGFPVGISGADLVARARDQALRFNAELVVLSEVVGMRGAGGSSIVSLADGTEVTGSAIVLAPGVTHRDLQIPSLSQLVGKGVYYGLSHDPALAQQGGDVYVVGGGNSAGQAALSLARSAASVTLLVGVGTSQMLCRITHRGA